MTAIRISRRAWKRTDVLFVRPFPSRLKVVLVAGLLGLGACSDSSRPSSHPNKDSGSPDARTRDKDSGPPDARARASIIDAASCKDKLGDVEIEVTADPCGSAPSALLDVVQLLPGCSNPATGFYEVYSAPPIAANATHVYLILQWEVEVPGDSGIWQGDLIRIPLAGGKVERMLLIPPLIGAFQWYELALTETDVLFVQHPAKDGGNAKIVGVPFDGGDPAVLAEAKGRAAFLIVDEQNAYFADDEGAQSVPLSGGAVRTLAPGLPGSLALVNDRLYVGTERAIYSVSKDGGDVVKVADNGGRSLVACGGENICWLDGALNASLMRLAPGKTPEKLSGLSQPLQVVFDGSNFFVTLAHPGTLVRAPPTGGTTEAIYVDDGLTSVALNATCLFWSSIGTIQGVSRSVADVSSWVN